MSGIHLAGSWAPRALNDAAVSSGMAFLVGELEKRDPTLLEPLTSVTWPRDIVAETGGGFVDFTSNYFVDYATAGANQYGIVGGQTNVIPILQANITKDVYPVFNWANNIKVPYFDEQKMSQVGRSLDAIFNDGLRLNFDKTLDQNTYLGFEDYGTTGLLNNPNVVTSEAPLNQANTSRAWADKTADEILADVDSLIVATWERSQYDLTGMANHILIDPTNFALINRRIVSNAGNVSILTYLLENNIAKSQGRELVIVPSRWCIDAGLPVETGTTASNRMVAYVNEKNRVSMDLPVPLTRAMTQPDVNQLSYLTAYVAQIGVVKIKYFQAIEYMDGI